MEQGGPESRGNYASAKGHIGALSKQFEEDCAACMMLLVRRSEAAKEWGSRLVVAGLAAIEKDDASFRVIHDGAHGARVNPRIVARDQIRSPGIAEARVVLQLSRLFAGAVLGLKGDVSKAHRRVKVRREDRAYQACTLEDGA